MKGALPCAVYTRKSSEDGLEQGFNSLDAQREACAAFILSQKAQGWTALDSAYEDGGFSGGNTERPGLKRLLADVALGRIKIVVVYKVDRLTRSLADFAKLVELFDAQGVSFVSVTQQFNTTSSMGRLTLNVLLSFAQFEREVTGERIRDKIAASKAKGMWMGGVTPVGYLPHERTLVIDELQAQRIREIFRMYLDLNCVRQLRIELDQLGWLTPERISFRPGQQGGKPFSRGHLYRILGNPIYIGKITHKGKVFEGQHPAIIEMELWQAVQDRLQSNRQGHRSRATAINPSLLTGLVFDHDGNRLVPTHAKKGARRYRYYVSQALLDTARDDHPEALRWPAQELEDTVLKGVTRFLNDEQRLIVAMGTDQALGASVVRSRLRQAAGFATHLTKANVPDRITRLQRLISRITIHPHNIELKIHAGSIWPAGSTRHDGEGDSTDQDPIVIDVPMEVKRCGTAVRLIVRTPGEPARRVDAKLTSLIVKAHDWFARLSSGASDGFISIANEEKVSTGYVARVVGLAFLAPDLIQKIQQGEQPKELNAERLVRMTPLPMDWNAQRTLLGMPP